MNVDDSHTVFNCTVKAGNEVGVSDARTAVRIDERMLEPGVYCNIQSGQRGQSPTVVVAGNIQPFSCRKLV